MLRVKSFFRTGNACKRKEMNIDIRDQPAIFSIRKYSKHENVHIFRSVIFNGIIHKRSLYSGFDANIKTNLVDEAVVDTVYVVSI